MNRTTLRASRICGLREMSSVGVAVGVTTALAMVVVGVAAFHSTSGSDKGNDTVYAPAGRTSHVPDMEFVPRSSVLERSAPAGAQPTSDVDGSAMESGEVPRASQVKDVYDPFKQVSAQASSHPGNVAQQEEKSALPRELSAVPTEEHVEPSRWHQQAEPPQEQTVPEQQAAPPHREKPPLQEYVAPPHQVDRPLQEHVAPAQQVQPPIQQQQQQQQLAPLQEQVAPSQEQWAYPRQAAPPQEHPQQQAEEPSLDRPSEHVTPSQDPTQEQTAHPLDRPSEQTAHPMEPQPEQTAPPLDPPSEQTERSLDPPSEQAMRPLEPPPEQTARPLDPPPEQTVRPLEPPPEQVARPLDPPPEQAVPQMQTMDPPLSHGNAEVVGNERPLESVQAVETPRERSQVLDDIVQSISDASRVVAAAPTPEPAPPDDIVFFYVDGGACNDPKKVTDPRGKFLTLYGEKMDLRRLRLRYCCDERVSVNRDMLMCATSTSDWFSNSNVTKWTRRSSRLYGPGARSCSGDTHTAV
jgi:hypothetical protein